MPAAYSTPLDSTAQFHLSHAFGDGTHSRSLSLACCMESWGKSRRIRALRNVRRWPRNAVPPSCQYGMARSIAWPFPQNHLMSTMIFIVPASCRCSAVSRNLLEPGQLRVRLAWPPAFSASVCVQALPASLPQPSPSPDPGAIFRQAMQPRFVPQTFRAPGSWRQGNAAQRRLQCRDSPGRLIACHISAVVSCHLTASGSGWECKASRYRPGVWRFTCGRRGTCSRPRACETDGLLPLYTKSCPLPIRPQKIGVCQGFCSFALGRLSPSVFVRRRPLVSCGREQSRGELGLPDGGRKSRCMRYLIQRRHCFFPRNG